MANKRNEELGAFAGPGYGGFGGSAGYSGAGAGGVSGGYTGGGLGEPPHSTEPWSPGPATHHDDQIYDDVRVRLEQADEVNTSELQISVEAGVVTLSGQVATREMRTAAVDIAERVPGVHRVKNDLHIEQPLVEEIREKLAQASAKLL
jgi:BON domain